MTAGAAGAAGAAGQERTETIAPEPAAALAGVLDLDAVPDDVLPPLWHWVYLLEKARERELADDGHAVRGLPAPPGLGYRRMVGGGRVDTHGLLRIGRPATRTTTLLRTVEKEGRSGPLVISTVGSQIRQDGRLIVADEQDIVYRAPRAASHPSGLPTAPSAAPPAPPAIPPTISATPELSEPPSATSAASDTTSITLPAIGSTRVTRDTWPICSASSSTPARIPCGSAASAAARSAGLPDRS